MKNFSTNNCSVSYSVEELKFKNLKDEKGKMQTLKSKSELFRCMYDAGMEISEISKECGSHYSFVYGVISSSRDIRKVEKTSKSDIIRQMAAAGKTAGQIAKELNSNYSFVFGVVKKFKNSLPQETENKDEVATTA